MGEAHDLVFWKNTGTTVSAIAAFNIGLVLVFLCGWPVLRLASYTIMLIMAAGLALSSFYPDGQSTSTGAPASDPEIEFISYDAAVLFAARICDFMNHYANKFYCLVLWKDTAASVKFGAAIGVLAFIFRIFPMWFLLLVGVNGAFAYTFTSDEGAVKKEVSVFQERLTFLDKRLMKIYHMVPKMQDLRTR